MVDEWPEATEEEAHEQVLQISCDILEVRLAMEHGHVCVLHDGADGGAKSQAEADCVDDVVDMHQTRQHLHVDERGLYTDGGADGPDAAMRILGQLNEPAVGRGSHSGHSALLCQVPQVGAHPDPHQTRRVLALPEDLGLLWSDLPLAALSALLSLKHFPHGVHCHVLPLLRLNLLAAKLHAEDPSGDDAKAKAPVDLLLLYAKRDKLHLDVPDRVEENQETIHASPPSGYGGGHEEA
mmetsp:Transcript_120163/g.256432  ORF Transcript_120163/g.256432 Transcript_120163/m.256432 type:complete len:238 (+) Transcript_120163:303-1016(+)